MGFELFSRQSRIGLPTQEPVPRWQQQQPPSKGIKRCFLFLLVALTTAAVYFIVSFSKILSLPLSLTKHSLKRHHLT